MANDGHPPTRPDGTNHGVSNNTPTTPGNVKATLTTMREAAALRAAGLTFREIGAALNIDHTWARTLVLRALDEAKYESADIMRRLEGDRLDALQKSLWGTATGRTPDIRSALAVVRIMERRAKLFGLDAPIRVEISDEIDNALRELEAQLKVDDLQVYADDDATT